MWQKTVAAAQAKFYTSQKSSRNFTLLGNLVFSRKNRFLIVVQNKQKNPMELRFTSVILNSTKTSICSKTGTLGNTKLSE